MRIILTTGILFLTGCAGSPPGAVSWRAIPPAPKPTTDWELDKGTAPVGRVAVLPNGTFDGYACPNGQKIGNYPTLAAAQAAVVKACKL